MRFAAWYKRRHLAALRIQRLYRGVATWKAALAGVQQTLASIKLQRVARGFLQRLRLFTQLRATAVESSTPIPLIPVRPIRGWEVGEGYRWLWHRCPHTQHPHTLNTCRAARGVDSAGTLRATASSCWA